MRRTLKSVLERLSAIPVRAVEALRARVGGGARRGGDASSVTGTPSGDPAFLEQVREALRTIEVEALDQPTPAADQRGSSLGARFRTAAARLGRLRGPLWRHWDALLAAMLLAGILILMIHWAP